MQRFNKCTQQWRGLHWCWCHHQIQSVVARRLEMTKSLQGLCSLWGLKHISVFSKDIYLLLVVLFFISSLTFAEKRVRVCWRWKVWLRQECCPVVCSLEENKHCKAVSLFVCVSCPVYKNNWFSAAEPKKSNHSCLRKKNNKGQRKTRQFVVLEHLWAVHVRPHFKTYYLPLIFREKGGGGSPWKSTVQNGSSGLYVKCTLSTVQSIFWGFFKGQLLIHGVLKVWLS